MTSPARTPRMIATAVAIAGALLLSGCGGGDDVGKGVNLKPTGPTNTCPVTGCATKPPTVKPGPTTKPPTVKPRATKAPAARPTTAKPKPVAPPFTITINGEGSGKPAFDPPTAAVYAGTKVIWKNTDSKPHGVRATNGAFQSAIPPGGSYTWVATAGNFEYEDPTRPFRTATIRVQAR